MYSWREKWHLMDNRKADLLSILNTRLHIKFYLRWGTIPHCLKKRENDWEHVSHPNLASGRVCDGKHTFTFPHLLHFNRPPARQGHTLLRGSSRPPPTRNSAASGLLAVNGPGLKDVTEGNQMNSQAGLRGHPDMFIYKHSRSTSKEPKIESKLFSIP